MSYQGFTVEVPIKSGLHGAKNPTKVPPTHLLRAVNCSFEDDVLQKEGGASKYNSTAIAGAPTIRAGYDWWPTPSTQRMIVYTGDRLLKDSGDGTFSTTLASGLTASDVCVFVEGGKEAAAQDKKLFMFTGTNQVKVLAGDGAIASDIASPAADWATSFPTFGVNHENRMWAFGNVNDPHRVYYSDPTNHEDFAGPNAGSLAIYPGEGQRLIGGVSFKNHLLILWKYPKGIYLVDTSNADPANWRVTRHTGEIGSGSPRGIIVVEDDVWFVDQVGQIQRLSSVQEFGSIGSATLSDIDDMNAYMRRKYDIAQQAEKVQAVYYARKREVHFAVPSEASTINDRRLVVDLSKTPALRWRESDRDIVTALWSRVGPDKVQQLVAGDDQGFVWLLDRPEKNKDGAGYLTEIQTAYLDFSWEDPRLAAKNKNGQFLELVFDSLGAWKLEVDVLWDGVWRQTMTFDMGAKGATLGEFVLDEDALVESNVMAVRHRLEGSGKYLSLVFRNNNADEDFSIAKVLVSFQVGDERARI